MCVGGVCYTHSLGLCGSIDQPEAWIRSTQTTCNTYVQSLMPIQARWASPHFLPCELQQLSHSKCVQCVSVSCVSEHRLCIGPSSSDWQPLRTWLHGPSVPIWTRCCTQTVTASCFPECSSLQGLPLPMSQSELGTASFVSYSCTTALQYAANQFARADSRQTLTHSAPQPPGEPANGTLPT